MPFMLLKPFAPLSLCVFIKEEQERERKKEREKEEMVSFLQQNQRPSSVLKTKLIIRAIYALLLLVFLRFYISSFPKPHKFVFQKTTIPPPVISSSRAINAKEKESRTEIRCDYSQGTWVRNRAGPKYNGSSCNTIKDGQNCMAHGRPDTGYLHWRWQPSRCNLPDFDPRQFLNIIKNKHLAFVGDSLARNQLESLLCLASTVSPPDLVHRSGDDNKFRRWEFAAHNATISIYWSPLLVKHIEKDPSSGKNHNVLQLDGIDERWASEFGGMDVVVFSVGHWFLLPAIYRDGDAVLGCHYCPEFNHTEIGFFDVFRRALKATFSEVSKRHERDSEKLVILTTFSPAHFQGEWNKAGACPKLEPYGEGEKEMEYMDAEMRRIGLEQVKAANEQGGGEKRKRVRFEAVDVTKLALMRPDGHPAAYMNPFPYAEGYKDRIQNDCVHWCLPGPIDTWNQILLQVINSWRDDDA